MDDFRFRINFPAVQNRSQFFLKPKVFKQIWKKISLISADFTKHSIQSLVHAPANKTINIMMININPLDITDRHLDFIHTCMNSTKFLQNAMK